MQIDDARYVQGNGDTPHVAWSCIELPDPRQSTNPSNEGTVWIINVIDSGVDDAVCFVLSVDASGAYTLLRTHDQHHLKAVAFSTRADAEAVVERLWHIFPQITGNLVWRIERS